MTHLSLRKSCDRCHEAKLKCVFDGSSSECCTRCRSRGADCVRSQSKPYGRTPGSRNKKRKRSQEPAQEPTPPLSQDGSSTSPCPDINTDDFWSGVQGWDLLDGKLSEDTSLGTNSTSTDSDLTTPPYDWLDTNTLSSIEDYTGTFSDYCSPLASFTGPDSLAWMHPRHRKFLSNVSALPQPAEHFQTCLNQPRLSMTFSNGPKPPRRRCGLSWRARVSMELPSPWYSTI